MTTATFTGLPEEIQIFQDNDLRFDVTVVDDSGVAFDLTNYVGVLTLKEDPSYRDSLVLLQKETDKASEGAIDDAASGTMHFLLDRTDTEVLKPGLYYFDVVIYDSTNDLKYTTYSGTMRVLQGTLHGNPAPTLASTDVSTGAAAGGTAIVLTGTGFQTGVTVTVGGTTADSIVRDSATQISCNTPAGLVGAADIVVTNPDGQTATLTGGFTYT